MLNYGWGFTPLVKERKNGARRKQFFLPVKERKNGARRKQFFLPVKERKNGARRKQDKEREDSLRARTSST